MNRVYASACDCDPGIVEVQKSNPAQSPTINKINPQEAPLTLQQTLQQRKFVEVLLHRGRHCMPPSLILLPFPPDRQRGTGMIGRYPGAGSVLFLQNYDSTFPENLLIHFA
jgi:hypothetical protein